MPIPTLERFSHLEFEDEQPMHERLRLLAAYDPDKDPEATWTLRVLMEGLGAPKICPRGRCRRAGRCLQPKVDCGFLHQPWIDAYIWDPLEAELRRRHRAKRNKTSSRARDKVNGNAVR